MQGLGFRVDSRSFELFLRLGLGNTGLPTFWLPPQGTKFETSAKHRT